MSDRAMTEFKRWEDNAQDQEIVEELLKMKFADDDAAIEDAFYKDLEFGTGGLRGIIGAGTNRMNIYTVAQATQGLADYLLTFYDKPSVVISRDSRHMGDVFSQVAASVLAGNEIHAYLFPRPEPTPTLSFAVRDLRCAAGINVTASHNPSNYNGFKVYGADGCHVSTQVAKDLQEAISAVDCFNDVKMIPFDNGLADGKISYVEDVTLDHFVEHVLASSRGRDEDKDVDLKIVYTPLNGSGLECALRAFEGIGVTDVTVVPEQAKPDGDFPTCPYPNPEIREALELGLELCEKVHPDLLIANDPDADRVGIAVAHDGGYVLTTGNEVGILLTDWLAKRAQEAGEDLTDKVVVTTNVSTAMLDALSDAYGFELRRVLTGFKYIGEQIGILEATGEDDRYLIGFEESYGYSTGPYCRDKNGIEAAMLICEMARDYKAQGLDLIDVLGQLYEKYGYYRNKTVSLTYPGAEGAAQMKAIMDGLRAEPPAKVGNYEVEQVIDYLPGAQMTVVGGCGKDAPQTLPEADMIELRLSGGNIVGIRPSGTEPKIKAYVFAKGSTPEESAAIVDELDAASRTLLGG